MPLGDILKKFRPNSISSPSSNHGPFPSASSDSKRSFPAFGRKMSNAETPSAKSPITPSRKRSVPLREVEEQLKEQLNVVHDHECSVPSRSSLSLTLSEVLSNPSSGALAYFVQYLEARDGSNLLKFWLDVEGKCKILENFLALFVILIICYLAHVFS